MPEEIELVHEETATENGFYLVRGDEKVGEMTYQRRTDGVLVFDHTWVDDSLRGQGQAGRLLEHAMDWVRSVDGKVVPQCPYVRKKFDEDSSFADLRA